MDTRGKTNAEFRNEVNEALARHESNFDQVNTTLQTVLTEIQALRSTRSSHACPPEVNPMAQEGSSHHPHATPSAAGYNHSPPSSLKLQFPKFNGEDPMGWIYKAEQYFEYQGIRADQRVQLASFHLEGIALQWHRWHTKFREPPTWEELTKAVLLRFGPTEFEDPSEALSRLKQTTTVATYQEAFERLSHRVDKLPETFLIGCFIAGLRDDIRLDVKIKQPRTLADTIGVARLVEERNQLQRRPTPINRMQTGAPLPRGNPNPAAGILGSTPSQRSGMGSNAPPSPFRRITNQEARERREKGLCYYCDEKYSLGHRCERPQLFMIEDAPHMEKENGENGEEPPQEAETQELLPEISFHAIAGAEHPQTLRVLGKWKNKSLMVLIDGGSTHNFIDQHTASRFGLPILRDKKLQVVVANRERIECTGRCQGLMLTIQGIPITADYYVLPVAACQAVLGVQWLETLGPLEMDYKRLTMSFRVRGTTHTLHGLGRTAECASIQVLNDKKCAGLQGTGFFFQIVLAEPKSSIQPYPPEIKSFLEEFSKVFETPTSIPPKRLHDHRILLQPDAEPAIRKWCPYLLGRRFIVRTDHQSLKYLLEQRITTPAQSRWLPKLLGYDYAIEYKKGPENQAADSLSRMGELQFLSISIPHADWWPTLQQEVREDPFYASLASRRDAHKLTLRDGSQPKKWVEWIPWAEFSYNTSIHSATKITPFEAVYGKPPPSLLTYVPGTARVQAVDEYLQDRDQILRELRHNLQLAQERMKSQANQHRREVSFNIGDYVYLKLQPYRQTSIAFRGSLKLSPRFYGPYKVIERVGPVAYKLDLPVGSLIHDTFHVSLLRKHLGTIAPTSPDLPPVAADSTILPQPESILARREVQKGKYRPKSEVLIKWVGTPVEDATWETEWRFRRAYPSFCP
ncbi:hypothetical protein F0562_026069 [Nyssa sinensis]|uniref:Chromo domain-containing protein n=1 Tax=Nyssa sinensis TaxID=561372 RepID=A0A5J5BCD1_9ASTE|nr:hypothetical protein F0562_026069 [Nyssa sinensis]